MASMSNSKSEGESSNLSAPAKVNYIVNIEFVDTSHWDDDGHRWTRRNFGFKTKEELKEFYNNLVKTKSIETFGRGTAGAKETFYIDLDNVIVIELTERRINPRELFDEPNKARQKES